MFLRRYLMMGIGCASLVAASALTYAQTSAKDKASTSAASTVKTLSPGPAPNSRLRTLNEIAASVDGTVVTRLQIAQKTDDLRKRMQAQGIVIPASVDLRKQVLERIVLETAQLNLAKNLGLKVDAAQVNMALENIAAQNRLSMADFQKRLLADGIAPESFKNELRNEILIKRVQDREVGSKVRVSEADIDQFLSQEGKNNQELNLAQILIQTPEGLSSEGLEQKRLRAEQALKRLQAGEDFSRISAEFSDSADALKGGEMGWRSVNKVPLVFVEAVANLNMGELSKVVRSSNGFHILRLIGRRESSQDATKVPQTQVRHILIKTGPLVSARQALTRITAVKGKLDQKEASFDALAKEFSEDNSKNKGGDLGWIFQGDTVPPFETAMNKLALGEVSAPVRTQFGYHLIEVLARKTEPLPASRKEMQARAIIYERKYEEALVDWLSQLRGQIHVETFNDSNS